MPGAPLSKDLKDRIVRWYYEDQDTMAEIAARARCAIGTVSNVLRVYREYGKVQDPFRQYTGRPSKLSEADLKFLDTIVVANPSLYLDEIQQRLRDVREVLIGKHRPSWISRMLGQFMSDGTPFLEPEQKMGGGKKEYRRGT